jgi:hypothetical protein
MLDIPAKIRDTFSLFWEYDEANSPDYSTNEPKDLMICVRLFPGGMR